MEKAKLEDVQHFLPIFHSSKPLDEKMNNFFVKKLTALFGYNPNVHFCEETKKILSTTLHNNALQSVDHDKIFPSTDTYNTYLKCMTCGLWRKTLLYLLTQTLQNDTDEIILTFVLHLFIKQPWNIKMWKEMPHMPLHVLTRDHFLLDKKQSNKNYPTSNRKLLENLDHYHLCQTHDMKNNKQINLEVPFFVPIEKHKNWKEISQKIIGCEKITRSKERKEMKKMCLMEIEKKFLL